MVDITLFELDSVLTKGDTMASLVSRRLARHPGASSGLHRCSFFPSPLTRKAVSGRMRTAGSSRWP
ncbi:hypothetical protein [Arthrobacter sp. MMS24-S77]